MSENTPQRKPSFQSIKVNPSLQKVNKDTWGMSWLKSMKKPVILENRAHAGHSILFSTLQADWKRLVLSILFMFGSVAAILSGLFVAASCSKDYTFDQIFLYTLGQLTTGPSFIEMSDILKDEQPSSCLGIGVVASTCTLALNAFVLSLAVRKFMKPKAACQFTKAITLNARNGKPSLQIRVANLRGNLVSEVKLDATFCRFKKTLEGESYFEVAPLKFCGNIFMKSPLTFTHVIDDDSPLQADLRANGKLQGMLFMQLSGYDHVLDDAIHAMWSYKLPDDVIPCARFADVLTKSVKGAIEDKSFKIHVNMEKFNDVTPSANYKECISNCSFVDSPERQANGVKESNSLVSETSLTTDQVLEQTGSGHNELDLDANTLDSYSEDDMTF